MKEMEDSAKLRDSLQMASIMFYQGKGPSFGMPNVFVPSTVLNDCNANRLLTFKVTASYSSSKKCRFRLIAHNRDRLPVEDLSIMVSFYAVTFHGQKIPTVQDPHAISTKKCGTAYAYIRILDGGATTSLPIVPDRDVDLPVLVCLSSAIDSQPPMEERDDVEDFCLRMVKGIRSGAITTQHELVVNHSTLLTEADLVVSNKNSGPRKQVWFETPVHRSALLSQETVSRQYFGTAQIFITKKEIRRIFMLEAKDPIPTVADLYGCLFPNYLSRHGILTGYEKVKELLVEFQVIIKQCAEGFWIRILAPSKLLLDEIQFRIKCKIYVMIYSGSYPIRLPVRLCYKFEEEFCKKYLGWL